VRLSLIVSAFLRVVDRKSAFTVIEQSALTLIYYTIMCTENHVFSLRIISD
jgi:hypothetical protein